MSLSNDMHGPAEAVQHRDEARCGKAQPPAAAGSLQTAGTYNVAVRVAL